MLQRFHDEKEKAVIVSCLRKVLKLQASAAQLEEQQHELKDSLPGVELPTDHSGAMKPDKFIDELEASGGGRGGGQASVTVVQASSIEARASSGEAADAGDSNKPKATPIEELLLKATISSSSSGRKASITTSGGGGPGLSLSSSSSSSPPSRPTVVTTSSSPIMNMLLKPKSLIGKGGPVGATLLNPLGLKASQSGSGTPVSGSDTNGHISSQGDVAAVTLDRDQLKATLLSLAEDDAFIDMLHERYASALKKR